MRLARSALLALALSAAVPAAAARAQAAPAALGPRDGAGLPPADTGRVAVGMVAPDFALPTKDDGVVTLTQFRGKKKIILVFYRGHW